MYFVWSVTDAFSATAGTFTNIATSILKQEYAGQTVHVNTMYANVC